VAANQRNGIGVSSAAKEMKAYGINVSIENSNVMA
jgi:hypothetical protein